MQKIEEKTWISKRDNFKTIDILNIGGTFFFLEKPHLVVWNIGMLSTNVQSLLNQQSAELFYGIMGDHSKRKKQLRYQNKNKTYSSLSLWTYIGNKKIRKEVVE